MAERHIDQPGPVFGEKKDEVLVRTSSASVSSIDDASSDHHSQKKKSMADLRKGFTDGARTTVANLRQPKQFVRRTGNTILQTVKNYAKFVGPGFMVSFLGVRE